MTPGSNRWPWCETLAPFAVPCLRHGLFAVATSAVPYAALRVVMYLTLGVSPALTVVLAITAAGFLVRVFVALLCARFAAGFQARERRSGHGPRPAGAFALSSVAS
jgi:hypothetical protein